jgi:O-antigen ligase
MNKYNLKSVKNSPLKNLQSFFLGLYFFSIHFESWDPFSTGIDYLFTKITIVFYILISLINFNGFKGLKKYKKFTVPLVIIFIIQTISGYLFQRPGHTNYFQLILFLNILIFLFLLLHNDKDRNAVTIALNSFVFGGLILCLFFLFGIETDNSWHGRVTVFGVNQNMLAINISVVLLIIIYRVINDKKIVAFFKFSFIIFIPILIYFLASTGSRSGFISLFFGLFTLVFFTKTKNIFYRLMSLLFGVTALTLLLYYFLNNEVVGERLNSSYKTGDLSGRDDYWETIPKLFDINPLFGIGRTGYAYETELIYGTYASAHNVFIEVLIMGGLISLVFLFIFLLRLIIKAKNNFRNTNSSLYFTLLMPIIVMSLVGHPLGTKISWGIFAFIIISTNSLVKYK